MFSNRLNRKAISWLLIMAIIVSAFPIWHTNAVTKPTGPDGWKTYLDDIGMPHETYKMVSTTKGEKRAEANYQTYQDYNVVVYGMPSQVPSNEFRIDKNGKSQPRYLGWDKEGRIKVTNADFPNDKFVEGADWSKKRYVNVQKSRGWNTLIKSPWKDFAKEVAHSSLLYNPVIGLSETDGLTVADINAQGNRINGTNAAWDDGTYTSLQAAPGWHKKGSIFVRHRGNSGVFYATMYMNGVASGASLLSLSASANPTTITMSGSSDTVSYDIDANAVINISGAAKKEHVRNFWVKIKDSDSGGVDATLNRSHSATFTAKRADLQEGRNTVEIPVSAHFETVFDESFDEDTVVTVTIIVEKKADPYLYLTGTVNPTSKEFTGSDVNVTVTADTNLTGVNAADVAHIILNVNGQTYREEGVTAIIHPFKFTIPASKLEPLGDDGSYTENFLITSTAVLKDGRRLVQKTNGQTVVYKDATAPLARISANREVRMGEDTTVTGFGTSPIGLQVEELWWGFPRDTKNPRPTPIYDRNPSYPHISDTGEVYWDSEGDKTINLYVKDENGNGGYDDHTITVLPPDVYTRIAYSGQQKENRVMSVTGSVDSPDHYPENLGARDWTMTYSGGLTAGEMVTKGYTDTTSSYQFVAKDDGQVHVSLYGVNTKGYSDRASTTIAIKPDIPPVVDIYSPSLIYRNPQDYNKAAIVLSNRSYSPDYDEIGQIAIAYKFDSDNDGRYEDEAWVNAYRGQNVSTYTIKVSNVGKYKVMVTATEKFEVVSGMNSADDFLSSSGSLEVTVDNIAPSLAIQVDEGKIDVDLDFYVGNFKGMKTADIHAYVGNSLKPVLANNGYNLANYTVTDTPMKEVLVSESTLYDEKLPSRTGYIRTVDDYLNPLLRPSLHQQFNINGFALALEVRESWLRPIVYDLKEEKIKQLKPHGHIWNKEVTNTMDYHFNGGGTKMTVYKTQNKLIINVTAHISRAGGADYEQLDTRYSYVWVYDIETGENNCTTIRKSKGSNTRPPFFWEFMGASDDAIIYTLDNPYYRDTWVYKINDNNTISYKFVSDAPISKSYAKFSDDLKWYYNGRGGAKARYFNLVDFTESNTAPKGVTWQSRIARDLVRSGGNPDHARNWQGTIDGDITDYTLFTTNYIKAWKGGWAPNFWNDGENAKRINKITGDTHNRDFSKFNAPYQTYGDDVYVKNGSVTVNKRGFQFFMKDSLTEYIMMWGHHDGQSRVPRSDQRWYIYKYIFGSSFAKFFKDNPASNVVYLSNAIAPLHKHDIYTKGVMDAILNSGSKLMMVGTNTRWADAVDVSGGFTSTDLNDFTKDVIEYLDKVHKTTETDKNDALTLTLDQAVSFNVAYSDFESDPMNALRFTGNHVNPNYFDNSNGTFDFNGYRPGSEVGLNKVGLYELNYSAQDKPHPLAAFTAFYKWSKPITSKVLVHRRPIALFTVKSAFTDGVVIEDKSYDLDHNLTDPAKGIKQWHWQWRMEGATAWTEGKPAGKNVLAVGKDYYLRLQVTDLENAKSQWYVQQLSPGPGGVPVTLLGAKVKARDAGFNHLGLPAGEWLTLYDIKTTYGGAAHHLWIDVLNDDLIPVKTIPYVAPNYSETDGVLSWNNVDIHVPSTFADKATAVRVRAVDRGSAYDEKDLSILIRTPVTVSGDVTKVVVDTPTKVTATTNKYATAVDVTMNHGTAYGKTVAMTYIRTVGTTKHWAVSYTETSDTIPDGTYTARFEARTDNGNTATDTDPYGLIANRPPSILAIQEIPGFIYEGDDVKASISVTDPDLDVLDMTVTFKDNGDQIITTKNQVVSPSGNAYSPVVVPLTDDIPLNTYKIEVSLNDRKGGTDSGLKTFTVSPLSVVGKVNHTKKWHENRIAYNRKKTGTDDSPRAYHVFWSGERFMLEADTTVIDTASGVRCTKLTVDIQGEGYNTTLSSADGHNWSGELWEESMMNKWGRSGAENLAFRFTATYSNGRVKVDDVAIVMDTRETFYEIHRLF